MRQMPLGSEPVFSAPSIKNIALGSRIETLPGRLRETAGSYDEAEALWRARAS